MFKKLSLGCLGLLMCAGIGVGAYSATTSLSTFATSEEVSSVVSNEAEEGCVVELSSYEHGKIVSDIESGNVGDICTLTISSEIFYKVSEVKVNGVALLPIEGKENVYKFALASGKNLVTATFVIDSKVLGEFSSLYEQARNKDWTNLFSFNNIMTIVSIVLKSGILTGLIIYVLKWKKIGIKVAETTKKELSNALPIVAEKTNAITLEKVTPIFESLESQMLEMKKALATFSKCFALMQQGDEDSKRAILDELSTLNLSDYAVLDEIKSTINKFFEDAKKQYQETLEEINSLAENSKSTIEEIKHSIGEIESSAENSQEEKEEEEEEHFNGTQI